MWRVHKELAERFAKFKLARQHKLSGASRFDTDATPVGPRSRGHV